MTIRDYGNGISRDTAILGSNVYAGNGQGCGTIWYPSVTQARKVVTRLGKVPQGSDSGLCDKCSCHYSFGTKEYKVFPEFACDEWKEEIGNS